MDWFAINLAILLISLNLLIGLPIYFKRKNVRNAARAAFQKQWDDMVTLDKQYAPHIQQLNKNLNIINYWLKTGKDPTESEEEAEKQEKEDRFFAGLMDPLEAKKWKEAVRKAKEEHNIDLDIKEIRVDEFRVYDMDPMDVNQTKMDFKYCTDCGDYIYYCATPDAVDKKMYRHVVYFTTSRPTNLPIVYPFKYEGAQMLSLYKHPSQTVWFLKNWKLIREGLEGQMEEEAVELDESITEFDL
ncbi:hypothetical protein [Pseudobutyrivibrio xylanivorans]|uniref:Uncharacterized protein n=1 Tax=Pseudobutyrivibrio xylanivorans TaxID=185007 RepID=A0A5P6VUD1_PSEXY|nr:hypothetical protein [Pseudobutyrivibrio xylanivorans]QFJ55918.1 hypothetical protein FXF36_13980 [Pseudobutyrivibrio xylanivorans]